MRPGSATLRIVSTATLALILAGCATTGGQAPGKSADAADAGDLVVTGTRVTRPSVESATPVTVIGADGNQLPPPPPPPPPAPPPPLSAPPAPMARMSAQANAGFVPPVVVPVTEDRERYDGKEISPVKQVKAEPVSTFSVDVDTGAYANARRFLTQGQLPPKGSVRTEEFINYFRYDYARPASRATPFTVATDMMVTPWNPDTRLLRIGLRGYDLPRSSRPPANLVFLVDVSGSMASPDKLPLVKTALAGLADDLRPQDRVSIVVYAGAAGLVLEPTNDPAKIRDALGRLQAGGSTAGGAGLQLAYQIARDNMIQGGVNRVILATDGDFNVGVSNTPAMIEMVEKQRDSGVTLTTLGFGQGNYNEALMEQVADHGNGNYAYIDSALEAKKVLGDEMSSTLFTIAKDVKIQVEFNPAQVSQYRLIGYENRALREEDFNNDKVDAGDIGASHQVTAIYEVVPAGAKGWTDPRRYDDPAPTQGAARSGEVAFVKLRYKLPDGATSKLIEQPVPAMLMWNRRAPAPDFRFAAAVAAFGQKLRGDPLLGTYSYGQIADLAGTQNDFWRQEFVRLVGVAGSLGAQPQ